MSNRGSVPRHLSLGASYRRPDFLKLAECYGLALRRATRCLDQFASRRPQVEALIARSLLSPTAKIDYLARFEDRLRAID